MYECGIGVTKDLSQAVCWFIKAKNKEKLLNIFKITEPSPVTFLPLPAELDIEDIEAVLLGTFQAMLVQNKYDLQDKNSTSRLRYCEQLEEIILQLMDWRQKLNNQAGLIMSCLALQNEEYVNSIAECQKASKIVYVKQHLLYSQCYVNIGEDNVALADAIAIEINSKDIYTKVKDMLSQLKEEYTREKTDMSAKLAYIERQLQLSVQDVLLSQELKKGKRLFDALTATLESLEEGEVQFNAYYTLVLEEIEKGQYIRNQKFKEEYSWLFE